MRNWIVILSLPLFALAACGTVEKQNLADNPLTIGVEVTNGQPTVDQPMATFDSSQTRIVWTLGLGSFAFYGLPPNGIAKGSGSSDPPPGCPVGNFDDAFGPCIASCNGGSGCFARSISCRPKAPARGTCYKYDVNVWSRFFGTPKPLDPWIKTNN